MHSPPLIIKYLFYKSIDIIITWLYDIVLTGWTPAYIAAAVGQVSSLSYLADHGADLNLANKDGNIYLFISALQYVL